MMLLPASQSGNLASEKTTYAIPYRTVYDFREQTLHNMYLGNLSRETTSLIRLDFTFPKSGLISGGPLQQHPVLICFLLFCKLHSTHRKEHPFKCLNGIQ